MEATADELDVQADKVAAPVLFAKLVRDGAADAVVCFDDAGKVIYPAAVLPTKAKTPTPDLANAQQLESTDLAGAAAAYARVVQQTTNTDLAALALQAQARCLVQAGKRSEAITVLTQAVAEERYRDATDAQDRLIVPNAELMALELLADTTPDETHALFER